MKKNLIFSLILGFMICFFLPSVYCEELTKEVTFNKDYSFCTFTVSGDNLNECSGYIISPNGGTYALSYIDGYLVTTIEKVSSGKWSIKLESDNTVPDFKASVSTSSLVSQGQDVIDTLIAKKVTNLKAYMEDETVYLSWDKEDDESVLVDIYNADTLESLSTSDCRDGKTSYELSEDVKRVIVKCVYYRYRNYDNAYTSYVFDKAELPVAEISFNCETKTNMNVVECSVNTDSSYTIYNNGEACGNSINFEEGSNHIVVKLTSKSGYVRNYDYTFIKDTKPPVISLNADLNQTSTLYEQLQISGTVTDAISLMVQGNYVQFNDEGYFETILNFNLGNNEIVIKATDDTGNVTEYIAYVTRYEEKKGINPAIVIAILSVLIVVGLVFFGKKWFRRNLRKELEKKEEENQSVKQELEEERYKATHDELTGCKNRTGYMQDLKNINLNDICIINFDVNNLKWTNDNLGHQSGDKLLLTISGLLNEKFENVYRMGGDEFSVLTEKYTFDENVLLEIDEILADKTKEDVNNIIYQVAYGFDFGDGIKTEKQISYNADQLMYEDKRIKKERLKEDKDKLVENGFSADVIDSLLKKHEEKIRLEASEGNESKQDYEDKSEDKKALNTSKSTILSLLSYVPYVIVLAVAYLLLNVVFFVGNIESDSMYPTMKTGDMIIGSRMYYKSNDVERGDIIFFKKDGRYLSKRVIGLPSDVVSFKNGYVVLNGEITKEEYLSEDVKTIGVKAYEVPDGSYFVMGDNRENSLDSRYWDSSYLPSQDVVGRVFITIPYKYAIVIKYAFAGLLGVIFVVVLVSEVTKAIRKKKK